MGIVITEPVIGAALAGLAVVSLVLWFLPAHVRVAVFGTLLTAGVAQMAWSLLLGEDDAVAVSGHVAAGLGLLWSMATWLLRWRHGERGRLTATHPGVRVAQFLSLAACLYAVLINVYLMIAQLSLALVHTWSYTVLSPTRWILSDSLVPLDFIMVAAACVVITHASESAYLLVPLFWALFLAVVRQCLLIPPVAPAFPAESPNPAGSPSLWILILLLSSAVMLGALVVVQALSWKNSRRMAWRKDVAFLLRPPRIWPGLQQSAALLGMFVLLVGSLLLIVPALAGSFVGVWPGLLRAAAVLIASIAVFTVANRRWTPRLGEIAIGLLTLSICFAVLVLLPRRPAVLTERFPLIFNALVFGCALSACFWMWLGGVWQQQLDEQGRPWTTAGRLVPLTRRGSFIAAAFGVLFALQMGLWPIMDQVASYDNSIGRILWGCGGLAALMAAAVWGYVRTALPAFRTLVTVSGVAIVLFGFVRALPYILGDY